MDDTVSMDSARNNAAGYVTSSEGVKITGNFEPIQTDEARKARQKLIDLMGRGAGE